MPQQLDDRRRLIVPRWRPFKVSALLGAIDTGREPCPAPELAPGEMEKLRVDWQHFRTPGHAADLVDAALLVRRPEIAADAAAFLLETDLNPFSRAIAQAVLSPIGENRQDPREIHPLERYRRIAEAKRSLRRYPRDPVRLVDLARDYSILGQNAQAQEALRRAVILAPDNRFVLRAASRFFLHAHEPEQAHRILLGSRTKVDPWLLAAEIVAASAAERSSRWIKHGQRLVEGKYFNSRHISELAGALGTLEHEHGNRRGVRRMFDRALEDPTENTVAQAAWLSRHRQSFASPEGVLHIPRAFEAAAWTAAMNGDYTTAIENAWNWLRDEPFATRPALFGSWVAATALGDYAVAAQFVRAIEKANHDDPRVIAQLVFCHASMNELESAEAKLAEMPAAVLRHAAGSERAEWDVLMAADRGLIAFRRGRLSEGRAHYEKALRTASDNKLRQTGAAALLYYARELAIAVPAQGRSTIAEAKLVLEAFPTVSRHVYEQILLRAEHGLR